MRAPSLFILAAALVSATAQANDRDFDIVPGRAQVAHERILQKLTGSAAAHFACAEFLSENGNPRAAIALWRQAQRVGTRETLRSPFR
jgi:hypothetical protein